ncbi:hypothetical protein E1267_39320 [Nonomuraea longispora]|uniref:ArsR family transcriptional regulator n=1 Tax=Nonomuraea longispora TaxID=1848320 RepID=A0A4R4MPH7_9ACTN|nr:hypothetical protein E1267_39320 [Nonomuraea longispora]
MAQRGEQERHPARRRDRRAQPERRAYSPQLAHRARQQPAQAHGAHEPGANQHLTALRRAGLCTAHRTGRYVLYARTATAEALPERGERYLDETPTPRSNSR